VSIRSAWSSFRAQTARRILMSTPTDEGDRPAITVVVKWPAVLKK
jgi:hypothetical protein